MQEARRIAGAERHQRAYRAAEGAAAGEPGIGFVSNRIRAVRMIGMLGLVPMILWRDVLRLAEDPNSRVRSAAVRPAPGDVGQPGSPQSIAARRWRTRTPAYSPTRSRRSTMPAWPDRLDLIVSKLHSENNRRAGERRQAAGPGRRSARQPRPQAMLQDPRPEHRVRPSGRSRRSAGGLVRAGCRTLASTILPRRCGGPRSRSTGSRHEAAGSSDKKQGLRIRRHPMHPQPRNA